MKILITTPSLKLLGGVANHYLGLKKYWEENVKYVTVGNRGGKVGSGKITILWDCLKLIFYLIFFHPQIVVLNPSIGKNALRREFLFQKISLFFKIKTVIFIHGFNLETFNNLNREWLKTNFNRASKIFVLATSFKKLLEEIGVIVPIEITTTKVDDELIKEFQIKKKDYNNKNLLFLARVEKNKGINETLDIYKILKKKDNDYKLNIVGDGLELQNVKERIKNEGIKDVTISGRLSGEILIKALSNATTLLLITTHGEGLPTSVLEGMAFGLAIITRPVGGLTDIFENYKMGFISDSLDPEVFSIEIEKLYNQRKIKEIGFFNNFYAKNNFLASKVANQLETSLQNL